MKSWGFDYIQYRQNTHALSGKPIGECHHAVWDAESTGISTDADFIKARDEYLKLGVYAEAGVKYHRTLVADSCFYHEHRKIADPVAEPLTHEQAAA